MGSSALAESSAYSSAEEALSPPTLPEDCSNTKLVASDNGCSVVHLAVQLAHFGAPLTLSTRHLPPRSL